MLNIKKIYIKLYMAENKKEILQYDIRADKWTTNSKLDLNIPVTTHVVLHGTTILIPGGEIRAGVRSPRILKGSIKNKGHE